MIRTHPRNRIATLLTTNIRDQVARALEHLQRDVTIAGYGQHARSAVLSPALLPRSSCEESADRFDLREADPIADTAVSHAESALCGASSVVSAVRVPAGPAGEPRGSRR
jgi:hypothetical protein